MKEERSVGRSRTRVSKGKKDRQIADALFISYHTVRAHHASIFRKLNANGKFHAVRIAEEMR